MARPKPNKKQVDKIEVEPGAYKRLAIILAEYAAKHAKEKAGKRGKGQRT